MAKTPKNAPATKASNHDSGVPSGEDQPGSQHQADGQEAESVKAGDPVIPAADVAGIAVDGTQIDAIKKSILGGPTERRKFILLKGPIRHNHEKRRTGEVLALSKGEHDVLFKGHRVSPWETGTAD